MDEKLKPAELTDLEITLLAEFYADAIDTFRKNQGLNETKGGAKLVEHQISAFTERRDTIIGYRDGRWKNRGAGRIGRKRRPATETAPALPMDNNPVNEADTKAV